MFYVALAEVKHCFGLGPGSNTNHLKAHWEIRNEQKIGVKSMRDVQFNSIQKKLA